MKKNITDISLIVIFLLIIWFSLYNQFKNTWDEPNCFLVRTNATHNDEKLITNLYEIRYWINLLQTGLNASNEFHLAYTNWKINIDDFKNHEQEIDSVITYILTGLQKDYFDLLEIKYCTNPISDYNVLLKEFGIHQDVLDTFSGAYIKLGGQIESLYNDYKRNNKKWLKITDVSQITEKIYQSDSNLLKDIDNILSTLNNTIDYDTLDYLYWMYYSGSISLPTEYINQ